MLSAATQNDGHGLGVLALLDEGHLVACDLPLLNQACLAQVVCSQVVNAGYNPSPGSASQLLHIALLHAPDGVDASLSQEVLGQVVNALLAEDHVGAGVCDSLDHILEHDLFLVQESLELIRGGDLDLGIDLGLLYLYGCVQEGDLGVGNLLGHRGMEPLLIDHHAVDDLGIGDASSNLLFHGDVIDIDVSVLINYGLDCLNCQAGELFSGGSRSLSGHCGQGDLPQKVTIIY